MSDTTVAYKVTLKEVNCDPEVRRFVVDRDVSTSYTYLYEKLATIFPTLRRKDFKLTWSDGDGDTVTIRSDDELVIALTEMKGPIYKMSVEVEAAAAKKVNLQEGESSGSNSDGEEHSGVLCDNCESTVVGFRYKCVTCPDYDLCGKCETKGLHPGHTMIRIATPQGAWPHHFYRKLHHMHDKMQKRSSSCHGKDHPRHGWASANAAFGMPGFPEGSTEGSNGASFRPGCGGMQGNKWLDAMMKGWAGASETHQASHQAAQEAVKEHLKTAKAFHEAAHGAATANAEENKDETRRQSGSFEDLIASTLGATSGTDFLKNLGQIVAHALDPLGVDVTIDVETPSGEKININEKKPEETTPTKSADSCNDETTTMQKDESFSSHEEDPDWTVVKTPEEQQATRQIPLQTQDNLYPELPSAPQDEKIPAETEVEKKKEPESEVANHPDPKIRVALQAMMNMGFTNDGGWLTQLLETKQGDIGKVLDVLQPSNPARR